MMNKFKLLIAVALIGGLMIARPALAFDEDKCTEDVGTAFTAKNGDRFCISRNQMQNWFTAFSWCRAVGGHLATLPEACNGKISSCENIKGSGRSDNAWLATPKGTQYAFNVNLSSGVVGSNGHPRTNASYYYYALCK